MFSVFYFYWISLQQLKQDILVILILLGLAKFEFDGKIDGRENK